MAIGWSIWRCRWSRTAALVMDRRGIPRDRKWNRIRDRVATLVRDRWFNRTIWLSTVIFALIGSVAGSALVVLVKAAL
jgi:hypothetical protein